jgi:enoyl-CoA hydratase/carnithine racemase
MDRTTYTLAKESFMHEMPRDEPDLGRRSFAKSGVALAALGGWGAPGANAQPAPNAAGSVRVQRIGHVLSLALDRPQAGNLLDAPMVLGLAQAYQQLDDDPALRVAVLFGLGTDFCLGVDVASVVAAQQAGTLPAKEDSKFINPFGLRARYRAKPLVVAVHGRTRFGGHELFLTGDVRVASTDSRFGQAEVTRGIFPAGGATVRFTREAGWASAMRYMLTGDEWGAPEALRMGLVQEVTPPGRHVDRAHELADKIAAAAPLGVMAALRSARLSLESEARAYAALPDEFAAVLRSEDRAEAARAQRDNRPPRFAGR